MTEELPLVQLDTVLDKPGAASDQPAIGGKDIADNLESLTLRHLTRMQTRKGREDSA